MPQDTMEFDRARRVLFDAVAHDYDRFRPGYPESAIDELIANADVDAGSRLLEIGCGTGQATISFAHRGYPIDAIELGAELAVLASTRLEGFRNVHIHNVPFASYVENPGTYRLIYSAQAFHWIEPQLRFLRSHELLAPGGFLALIYNYTAQQAGPTLELSFEIEAASKGALSASRSHYEIEIERWSRELVETPLFHNLTVTQYPWDASYTADEYVGLFRTYSDFNSLSQDLRDTIAAAIRHGIEMRGGTITRRYVCTVFLVRRD